MQTLLVVDDSKLVREMLDKMLRDKYHIIKAKCGHDAIEILKIGDPNIKMILLDLIMADGDGYSVLEYMQRYDLHEQIPVVVMTAETDVESLNRAYDMGAVEVIQKPFESRVINRRIRNLLELYERENVLEEIVRDQIETLRLQTDKLLQTNEIIVDALSAIIEYRSLESGQHTKRIRGLARILLMDLVTHEEKYTEMYHQVEKIAEAATMHDIGKIAIPDAILLKPGKLTDEEFKVMKTHTTKGCEILYHFSRMEDKEYLKYCQEICLGHHERYDGRGYPDGISGDDIPISAQVVSLVDAYDALTHVRIYKDAYSYPIAEQMIIDGECGAFSPMLLLSFRRVLPELRKFMEDHPNESF